ncbi:MAG: NADH-quinone oxidoreductase subunit NuoF [Elusimicrobia bacterium]|nr:NADH-quinone oxidoreductase subunit NuoF [Elusimicrobiota bacterium]
MTEKKILICAGTSGISAGACEVFDKFKNLISKNSLKISVIKTGDRGLFRDVLVDVILDGKRTTYELVKPEDVDEIFEKHILNGEIVKRLTAKEEYENFFKPQMRIVLKNCGLIDPEDINDYIKTGGYKSLEKVLKQKPEEVIVEIKKSGLRGRGGAGFPTGLKWELARKSSDIEKFVICNADEGDPGAFMDRSILEGDPHSVIEGMIIAGYCIGANTGIIYCRAEYPVAIKRIKIAIKQAQEKNFLGEKIFNSNFSFKILLKQGAGAFVCGEETALIASLEGKRGMPRPRPPFPAQKGLWGKPTVINNVETLANIPRIIENGARWYSKIGTKKSKGTKVFALAGNIKNTGLVEIPMGTTIRELIFGPGGGMQNKRKKLKAVQIGGPSGGCIPESLIDTPIDYESITKTGAIMGSGGFIVMDESTCMVDITKFFLSFTVAESCGKCPPCRIGLKRMLEILEKITKGEGSKTDIEMLRELALMIKKTALCGLGNTAPNPVLTTLNYFLDEYMEHIEEKKCRAKVCVELLKFRVIEEKCKKCGLCFKACPVSAIEWEKGKIAKIINEKCIKCRACIKVCPWDAIE